MKSLSARRAWIEILLYPQYRHLPQVALRKESVDRNKGTIINCNSNFVALRKESVDRNSEINTRGSKKMVALRKESVDRNLTWHCMSEDVS